jgi:EmrB/QacA subfamily drug resistance transporter
MEHQPHYEDNFPPVKDRYIILAIVLMGILMSVIDGNVVSIALPTITQHFNVNVAISQWTITAYLLTMTALMLVFGKVSEYTGKTRLFIIGFIIFTLSSLACGLSQNMEQLIAFRVAQGFGASMVFSISGAIIYEVFPVDERGRAMGFLGSTVAIGSIAGPVLGGFMVDTLGWEYIFFINVPIGIVLVSLALKYLKISEYKAETFKMDWKGSALLIVSMSSLILFLGMLADQVSLSYILAALAIIFIASAVAFIYREKHFAHPLLDLSIFNDKKFTLPAVSMILFFIGNFMLSIVGPFYFQGVMGYTASQVGMIFLIAPIIMVFGSPIFGWLYDKHYSKYYAFAGMGIVSISFILLGFVAKRADLALIIFAFIISAIGGSMYQSPNNTDTMSAVPRKKLGTASSVTSTMRNLGMALGVSLATILISLQLHLSGYTGPILEAGAPLLSSVISIVMFCSGAICAVSAIAALLRNI